MADTLFILLRRSIALFLALYLFNFSVDSKDALPDYVEEDLSYNDIESVYEIVLEDIFGVDNAVVEFDEHDLDDGESLDSIDFTFYNDFTDLKYNGENDVASVQLRYNTFCVNQLVTCWAKINDPPPWMQPLSIG